VQIDRLDYVPDGGGAYHWVAEAKDARWFVTADDLDTKPWLSSDRDAVFTGLSATYRTAMDLRQEAKLGFVVAPRPALSAEPAIRLGARYSLAVFPFVEGQPGRWGEPLHSHDRRRLLELLAELHRSTAVAAHAPRRGPEVAGREQLEQALRDLGGEWSGGPFSELVRRELGRHAEAIAGWLESFDEIAARIVSDVEPVVTHGEPHPGNLIRTSDGFALVDWDTVAVSRAERDLWMFADVTGSDWGAYEELTGWSVDLAAMALYRHAWRLADLAAFTGLLRGPHRRSADTEKAWMALRQTVAADPSPYRESAIW
jgi:spectinomycin phosphotransferase